MECNVNDFYIYFGHINGAELLGLKFKFKFGFDFWNVEKYK